MNEKDTNHSPQRPMKVVSYARISAAEPSMDSIREQVGAIDRSLGEKRLHWFPTNALRALYRSMTKTLKKWLQG